MIEIPSMSEDVVVWRPIAPLTSLERERLPQSELTALAKTWRLQQRALGETTALRDCLRQIERRWAVETGVIENLYTLDRGVTETLIAQGVRASLISHLDTNRDTEWVAQMIQTQLDTVEGLFGFIKGERPVGTSYIKELHAQLTVHQDIIKVRTPDGHFFDTKLLKGAYKQHPNNPRREDGTVYEYCPPSQVAPEMESLVKGWLEDEELQPEVLAAWVHHRFTQIHPFQDGNGRVARCLATLVFLRAGLLPLVVTRDDKVDYIDALEAADAGDLEPLVQLFARLQIRTIQDAIRHLPTPSMEDLERRAAALAARRHKAFKNEDEVRALVDAVQTRVDLALVRTADRLHRHMKADPKFSITGSGAGEMLLSHPRYGASALKLETSTSTSPPGASFQLLFIGPNSSTPLPLWPEAFSLSPEESGEEMLKRLDAQLEEGISRGVSLWLATLEDP